MIFRKPFGFDSGKTLIMQRETLLRTTNKTEIDYPLNSRQHYQELEVVSTYI